MTLTHSDAHPRFSNDAVIDWLLDTDPSIRWQVMRDLTDTPADIVAAERSRVASEGWGPRLLDQQRPDGHWGDGITTPLWDWVFGTLRAVDYVRPPRGQWRELLDVDWGWPSARRATHPERVRRDRRALVRHVEEHDRGSHDSTVERNETCEHQVEPDQ